MAEIRRRGVTDQCSNPSDKPRTLRSAAPTRVTLRRLFRRLHRSVLADQRGQSCIRCDLGLLAMHKQG
jgi:hypothetical protein